IVGLARHEDRVIGATEGARRFVQRLRLAGRDAHLSALGHQAFRDAQTDASTGTRDQGDLAGKARTHCYSDRRILGMNCTVNANSCPASLATTIVSMRSGAPAGASDPQAYATWKDRFERPIQKPSIRWSGAASMSSAAPSVTNIGAKCSMVGCA